MTDGLKRSEDDYLRFDPFDGDRDVDIRMRTVKLVRVRKPHRCHLGIGEDNAHDIAIGELARNERAFVDGSFWGSYYVCIPCMDRFLDEVGA